MDTGVSVSRAARRRLWEVTREVAGDDIGQGQRLVAHFRDQGALRLDPGAFTQFDNRQARQCLRSFLGARAHEFILATELVPAAAYRELCVWEAADLPLPVGNRWAAQPEWLSRLLEHKLVRPGPRGMTLSPRLRLHLWLAPVQEAPQLRRSPLLREGLRTLRRQGRWHEAARWAEALVDADPGLLEGHPSLPITILLGYAQSQNYAWLHLWLASVRADGRLDRLLENRAWKLRLDALTTFVDIERGEITSPVRDRTAEGRFWRALVSCWGDLYAGRYGRALRLLDFIQKRRPDRIAWLDTIVLAWRAAALHYLERYPESRECNLLSLRLAGRLGWRERELVMLRNFAVAQFENGEVEQSMAILRGLENRHMIEHRLAVLPGVFTLQALILNLRIRLGTGAWTNRRAQHLGIQAEGMHQFLYFKEGQAVRARRSGLEHVSEQLFLEVEELAKRIGHPLARGHAVWNRARLAWCRSAADLAFTLLTQAEALFADMNQITRQADMKCDRALFYLEQGRFELADREIEEAEGLYGRERKPREAAILQLLKLELLMRQAPESLEESHLNLISSDREDTMTRTAYAYAIVALGFALLDDPLSAMDFGKQALSQINRLQDPFITSHILHLGNSLRNYTGTADEIVSYWLETFPFQGHLGRGRFSWDNATETK